MNDRLVLIKQEGFSLIELIIVLLIIAIIVAIAIPNIIATRRSANEGSAISSLRTLHAAQLVYKSTRGAGDYAGTASPIGDTDGLAILRDDGMIDPVLGAGTKSGYKFVGAVALNTVSSPATFFFSANPIISSGAMKSGTRRYCITQQGVIGADPTNLGTAFNETTAPAAPPFFIQ